MTRSVVTAGGGWQEFARRLAWIVISWICLIGTLSSAYQGHIILAALDLLCTIANAIFAAQPSKLTVITDNQP